VTVKFREPPLKMMFWPTFTEAPRGFLCDTGQIPGVFTNVFQVEGEIDLHGREASIHAGEKKFCGILLFAE
jgi:hypothetical protein